METGLPRYAWLYDHQLPQKVSGHATRVDAMQEWQAAQPEVCLSCSRPGPDIQ